MKRFLGPASLIVVLAVAAVFVGPAVGSKATFTASYKGKVTEVVNGSAVTAKAKGNGKGTLIGTSTLVGKVKASTANPPCTPLSGPGVLTGVKKTLKITLLTGSRACAAGQDDPNNITFSGKAKVTGGTGKLRRATGTLRYLGHYDRGTGAFKVTLTGTLKY